MYMFCGLICWPYIYTLYTTMTILMLCVWRYMQEASLTEEVTAQRATLSQALEARKKAETELVELREESTSQISHLMDSLEQKSKAGEERGEDNF